MKKLLLVILGFLLYPVGMEVSNYIWLAQYRECKAQYNKLEDNFACVDRTLSTKISNIIFYRPEIALTMFEDEV